MRKVSRERNRLPVSFTINECMDTKDSRFLAITIDVLHTGLNFNGSIFKKEIVDANADSIVNTPVLGYIALSPDGELDFQGHEYKTIEDEHGESYVYAGSAYGVIPESCNYRWIEKVCSDGIWREFFQVDALLWAKFDDAIAIFERDGKKPQSMELELSSITGEQNDDGTFTYTGFKFDGCCLLSSTDAEIQPAMIDSEAVTKFTANSIAQEIKNRLVEYTTLVDANTNDKDGDKMGKTITANFTLNLMEQLDEIRSVLSEKRYRDKWGYECSQYCFVDAQDDEVIVMDRADHYRIYGIKFSMDGDKISIDFDQCIRKKTKYENLEDGASEDPDQFLFEQTVSDVATYLSAQIETANQDKIAAEKNYTAIKNDLDEIKPRYDAYVIAEQQREKAVVEAAKDAEFKKFDQHLSDNKDYTKLKENRDKYTLDDIQGQCAILFTQKNLNTTFNRNPRETAPTVAEVFTQIPPAEVSSRYGVLPTKKN